MAYKKDRDVREAHPGWAVRFEDGTWLGGAHGWFRAADAFYADIYDSKEEAQGYLDGLRNDTYNKGEFDLPAEVIEAWQPICESLRHEVRTLKQANIVSFSDIYDLKDKLLDIVSEVNDWQERGKKAAPYSVDEE